MGKSKELVLPPTLEEAHSLITSQAGIIESQNETIAEQNKTIEEQNQLLLEQGDAIKNLEVKAQETKTHTVTIGKKTYTVACGVRENGVNLTPAEVASDKKLCEKLLAIEGQTILVAE